MTVALIAAGAINLILITVVILQIRAQPIAVKAIAVAFATMDISLHTDDPGINGNHEITGGGYTRQPATYHQSTRPGIYQADNLPLEFIGPPHQPVEWVGMWLNDQLVGTGDIVGDKTFNPDGHYQIMGLAAEAYVKVTP